MKKRYLTCAGIVSAAILAIMFAGILITGSFTIFPSVAIDPITDHRTGDLIVITGTTNLKENTRLELEITSASPLSGRESRVGATDAFIVRGTGMTNTWSGALDTSAIPPGEYLVKAYPMTIINVSTNRGDLLATTRFTLTNTTLDADRIKRQGEQHKSEFIRIDHIGTIFRGEKILVTGSTNLPAETELLYIMIPQSNTSVLKIDPKTRMREVQQGFTRSGLTPVLGDGYEGNHWSFAIDTTEFIQDEYEVIVTTDTISSDKIGKEGTFGTASMTVLESDLNLPPWPVPSVGSCQVIRIDPFPDTLSGKTQTITGTTSLPAGTELLFQVLPAEFKYGMNPASGNISGMITGAMGAVKVIQGPGGNNTWSLDINPSQLPPSEYLVNVSNDRIDSRTYETRYGNAFCSCRITITGDGA